MYSQECPQGCVVEEHSRLFSPCPSDIRDMSRCYDATEVETISLWLDLNRRLLLTYL